jgi:hypothetical protein
MGNGTNNLKGKVTNKGSMYVKAEKQSSSKKPTVEKGGDLRSKSGK